MSSKRTHSPENQRSVKRPNQEPDPQAASPVETIEQLLRRVRSSQLYAQLSSLISSQASSQTIEACYTPVFKEIAQIAVGRVDIPVPPEKQHRMHFLVLFDTGCTKLHEDEVMRALLDYIMAEDKKRPRENYTPKPEVLDAIKTAWNANYVGEGHRLLQGAINQMYLKSADRPYGNTCAMIQGSGTGKSRLVDKLAESVLAIPIILRPDDDKLGFPLGDVTTNKNPLVNFFCGFTLQSALYVQRRYLLFLLKALDFVSRWIDDQQRAGVKRECFATEWKKFIGDPRSQMRIAMYTAATSEAPLESLGDILDEKVEFDTVQKKVRLFVTSVSKKIQNTTKTNPAILFYFDEAHHLTKTTVTAGLPKRTAYQCLCKAFTYMMNSPIFALFLSTYSRLSDFAPSARNFWSSRPESSQSRESDDNLNAPFVELPFDNWKEPILVTEGSHSAEEICSLTFIARFGRPLFWALLEHSASTDENDAIAYAMDKLRLRPDSSTRDKPHDYPLDELIPLLAARIDLTFESNRDEAVFLEGLLVASSMRTVYSVPQHRQYLRGGYPSEPFLGEAAARAIYEYCRKQALGKADPTTYTQEVMDKIIAEYKDQIPLAILSWFERGLVDKGNRGELVARMLCTLAHDIAILRKPSFVDNVVDHSLSFSQMIPVVDFLRALISAQYLDIVLKATPSNLKGKTLEEAFKDAFVHFTQFVKAGDKSTVTDEAVYLLFLRAAAIQGYGNMDKADLVIPVWLRRKGNPDRWCMTAIFIQVKNRVEKQFILIDAQNIFQFFTTHITSEDAERPYITIAMELGVLEKEQRKAPQPMTKKATMKLISTTPKRQTIPLVAKSAAKDQSSDDISALSRTRENLRSEMTVTHPRYEIFIRGCSKVVYNVIGDVPYSGLLAHKDMLAEHPRSGVYLDAIEQMKPYWRAYSSYTWAQMKKGSRIGAHTIKREKDARDEIGSRLDFRNQVDDSEEEPDGVIVNTW